MSEKSKFTVGARVSYRPKGAMITEYGVIKRIPDGQGDWPSSAFVVYDGETNAKLTYTRDLRVCE